MWNLNKGTNELIYRTEIVTDIANKLMATEGEGGGINREIRIYIYKMCMCVCVLSCFSHVQLFATT